MAKTFNTEGWSRIRAGGPVRFILIRGVLLWGCVTGILLPPIRWLRSGEVPTASHFAITVLVCAVLGVLFGAFLWSRSERAYHAELKKIESSF